jgi:hypothetical protein
VANVIAEIKCPQCGRDTQYGTGNCEWCGAALFQQRQDVHQAAQAVMPAAPDRRLLYDAVHDRQISWILHGVAIVCWVGLVFGLRGFARSISNPTPLLIAVVIIALGLSIAGNVYYVRSRRYCPCPKCGGVMMLGDKMAIRPWYLCGRYQSPIYNYLYLCPSCGNSLGITGT